MNPLSLKATAIIGAASALLCLSLLSWALWLRADLAEAQGDLKVARAQLDIVSTSLARCNAGVEDARRSAAAAIALGAQALAAAQAQASAAAPAIASLEKRLAGFTGGCDAAWASIEIDYKASRGLR